MHRQPPTAGRLAVVAIFAIACFGMLLFVWLAFGGPLPLQPQGYRFHVAFPEAQQLAKEADVRISGVPVGRVKDVELRSGATDATIELEPDQAPLPSDARAILRQKTLLGESYVELTPGSDRARPVPEGGRLATRQVSPTVELDEIFRALDGRTRAAFQRWMQQQAQGVAGRGQGLNDALGNLAPTAVDATALLRVLRRQEGAVEALVSQTGAVAQALTERSGELRGLVVNANRVVETTAARNRRLGEVFTVLPTTQRETRATLASLDAFAARAGPVVRTLRPAARELSPTLRAAEALAGPLRELAAGVGPAVRSGESGLPAIRRTLDHVPPLLGQLAPVLRQLNPPLEGLAAYRRELTAFFANTVASSQATDRPVGAAGVVHYARGLGKLTPESLAVYPRRIGSNRSNPYPFPGASLDLLRGRLPVYGDQRCGAGNPAMSPVPSPLLPEELKELVSTFAFAGAERDVPAPPCRLQRRFRAIGDPSRGPARYPRFYAEPPP